MITFDLTKNQKQKEFFNKFWMAANGAGPERYFFYGGAVRGGKTSVCLNIIYLLARKYNNSRWHILRESYSDLQDTTIPSWEKFYPDSSPYISRTIRAKDNYHAIFKNGSKVFFKSQMITKDPLLGWMDGLETNGIFLEQMEGLSELCFNKSLERIGSWYIPDMPIPVIFGSFNPTQRWPRQKIYDHFKKGTLDDSYLFVEALPDDNPFVTDEQWNAWGKMDTLSYEQRIKGDWDAFAATAQWAHAFNESTHTGIVESNYNEPFYLSFDFNHDPVTCTIWQHYEDKIRCLHEVNSSTGLKTLCDKIKNYFGFDEGIERIIFVTGDRSGWNKSELLDGNRTAYDIIMVELGLTNYQIQTPNANPNVFKSRELVNGILEHHQDFMIDSRHCPNSIFDLKFVEADSQHKIVKDRNKTAGKADFLDTIRYYLNSYHQDFIRA